MAPFEISLPLWLTQPLGDEQRSAPVMLGMSLPSELTPFGKRFAGLPPWYVYGTVRCLGADELLASGDVRTHMMNDGMAEYRHVSDSLRYNVDERRVEEVLSAVTQAVAGVSGGDRDAVLRANIRYYDSGYGLFALSDGAREEGRRGLETFRVGVKPHCEDVGWRETESELHVTQVGDFTYGDPLGALRKTEEDAIAELARGATVRLAHLQKNLSEVGRDIVEETTKETIKVRIRGVRVLRRCIDLSEGSCSVTVGVSKGAMERIR